MDSKENTKIIIRVDGSSQIGLGHVVRCLSLAHILKEDFQVSFYCLTIPSHTASEVTSQGFDLIMIKSENDFFATLTPKTIVVIDGYNFDTEYQISIKQHKCKLVCIDDLFDKKYVADLIINHTPGIEARQYLATPYTQFALGLNYALLRPSFLNQAKEPRLINNIKTAFVCFGGSDPENLTERVLQIVLRYNQFEKIIVVTGSGFIFQDNVFKIANLDSRIELHHSVSENKMLELMLNAELAIVPSSGILLECLSAGCIVVSGMYADNQKFIYQKFKEQKLFSDAVSFSKKDVENALDNIFNESKFPVEKTVKISSNKLLKLFNQLENSINSSIRRANEDDLKLTFSWATDKVIRANSFSKHEISLAEHSNWFLNKVTQPDCYYFIFVFFDQSIGSIRFDKIDQKLRISYLLSPEYHGRGLGTVILYQGIEFLYNNRLLEGITEMYGDVFSTNIPSLMAFRRLGFVEKRSEEYYTFIKQII